MTVRDRPWRFYTNRLLALEISAVTRYYDRMVQYGRVEGDDGLLLDLIECRLKASSDTLDAIPDMTGEIAQRSAVLLNGTLNHSTDIQGLLAQLRARLAPTSRVIAVVYNSYYGWLYRLARRLGVRAGPAPTTFVTFTDLVNIARLSGYRLARTRSSVFIPFSLLGIGTLINAIMPAIPLLRNLSLTTIVILAPERNDELVASITVVIPARNERGNIKPALDGLAAVHQELPGLEVILVEGHSTDGTWEEIQRLVPEYKDFFKVVALQQEGRGKGDAVRLGFSQATSDLLTILDADLTVSPALLGRFYDAYRRGHGELVNGSRLVYASESQAMRFLNSIGNVVFAKLLSYVLSVRLGDSLCGTKLLARHDYARFTAWRNGFGDFDPFGDFELLFPAAVLGLTVVDVPIRYGARNYGTTNISRFTHGWMLLKMTIIGFFRVRLGKV